jgi:hypothetical protein
MSDCAPLILVEPRRAFGGALACASCENRDAAQGGSSAD